MLVFELFMAHIITLIITSPKHIVMVLLLSLANFENSALTPIQLLFQLVCRLSSKILDALLTRVSAAKGLA